MVAAVGKVNALEKDEIEEERVWLLPADEEAEEVDSEDVCTDEEDITFLTAPLLDFSFRFIILWKVLMFDRLGSWVGGSGKDSGKDSPRQTKLSRTSRQEQNAYARTFENWVIHN